VNRLKTILWVGIVTVALSGCGPTEQTHARAVGGLLKSVYGEWLKQGRPTQFEPTNCVYTLSTSYGKTNQCFVFTNTVVAEGSLYHCRFAIRDETRFIAHGVIAVADGGVLLWVGDDGKIIVAPDTKNWSSK
jgi:hypothetical protein